MLPLKVGPGGGTREALGAGSPDVMPTAWNREEKGNEKLIPWQYLKVLLKSSHYFLWAQDAPLGCWERWGRDHHGHGTEGGSCSKAGEQGCLERHDWGKSALACHLRASPNKHSMMGFLCQSPGWEVNSPGQPPCAQDRQHCSLCT